MANVASTYRAPDAASLANPTAATVFLQAKGQTTWGAAVKIPGGNQMNGKQFRVRASGRATTGATSNFKATVQYAADVTGVNAATAASNTDAVALTNRSYATVTRSWSVDAVFQWDSTSLRLSGQSNGVNAETIETASVVITALTAVDLSTETCGFVVSCIFGTSNASNVAFLDNLSLEVL